MVNKFNNNHHQRHQIGYTLIEILVVLFIISIATTVVLLSIHINEQNKIAQATQELVSTLQLAEEQAILQQKILGLYFTHHGIRLATYEEHIDDKNKLPHWAMIKDAFLIHHDHIPHDITITLIQNNATQNETENHDPPIVMSTNGSITSFKLTIAKKGHAPLYQIEGNEDGTIKYNKLS